MAQFTSIDINIDGRSIKQFTSIALSQSIFEHHTFRLVCPTEAIDGTSGNILNTSRNFVGSAFTLQIQSIGNPGNLKFAGVVTQVEAARHSGHAGDVIISGYSPTILLDNGPHCKSWEKKAMKNIAEDVLKHFPQNLLQPKIAPSYSETLSYTVQYKETAWQFLQRLNATHGEWLFYDGQKLIIGTPQGGKAELTYGSNLSEFNMALQVLPATFQMLGYDYMNNEVYNASPSGIAGKAGLNDLGKHTLQKSEQFYATQPKQWHRQFLTNKKQLDDFTNTRAAMQSSNMVRFNGNSGHPGIQVGGTVSVQGKNVFSQANESFGDYTVVSANHYCDGQGNYTNDFIAIPASVKAPPVNLYTDTYCETQSALVTDNHDKDGLGRVRVKFHWMSGSEKSPWLRISSPHGGGGKGMFFIPEIGEEVIVGFEGDSPVKPYIIGTVYHGKAKNEFSNSENDIKALQTRSGNKIVMNDKEGSVFVEDKDGNSILIDGAGNITLKSNKTVLIDAVDEITFKTKKITMIAENEITMESKKFDGQLSEQASLFGNNLVEVTSNNKIDVASNNEVSVSGKTKATMEAVQTQVTGSAQATVQGAMVKLNC